MKSTDEIVESVQNKYVHKREQQKKLKTTMFTSTLCLVMVALISIGGWVIWDNIYNPTFKNGSNDNCSMSAPNEEPSGQQYIQENPSCADESKISMEPARPDEVQHPDQDNSLYLPDDICRVMYQGNYYILQQSEIEGWHQAIYYKSMQVDILPNVDDSAVVWLFTATDTLALGPNEIVWQKGTETTLYVLTDDTMRNLIIATIGNRQS